MKIERIKVLGRNEKEKYYIVPEKKKGGDTLTFSHITHIKIEIADKLNYSVSFTWWLLIVSCFNYRVASQNELFFDSHSRSWMLISLEEVILE